MGLAYDFDWSVLWRSPYGFWLLKGLGLTVLIGICSWIIALALGIFIGTLRVTPYRLLRFAGTLYVEVLRNIPLLVQMFFWYYAGPMLFGETLGRQINHISGLNVYVAIFGLGLYTASRVAEHVRAGFASIHRDQYQAVLSTGMTRVQMYRYVIIPYALRLIIPPLTTEFLTVFKNTSIAMTIGVAELTFQSYQIDAETFHGLETTTGTMIVYLLLGISVVKFMGMVEKRFKIHGLVGR
ncbi:MAG: amino acid ABC transporter permease [Deltaproteobacteria bacterium]|nr:amino acid ABC transporter permease [Deltaproteobacteria bacterium]MBW2022711.1 amino acid ABC transporter permease [Deltaproteobacteria bacterium]MBW2084153.1 amino acid ABC transporter permease [Deltaproteobacteria bacterium]